MPYYAFELFSTLLLDTQHRLIGFDELFRGTIYATSIYLREAIKQAIEHNVVAAILYLLIM
ncbi:JAB domain-containing protein [Halomonas sp. N3-2A]|uniref:JAB domain-containing protein n=1 Tax=Halomonas sp. N3-2A TaxID=2014541 RepID=UPI000B5B405B|nr:JAB domain-containing protein [Halomonas sp. N3-2A]ASK17867.1 hypothetical protein CEK60_00405 [Halomonas sp. N3-2A]